MWEARGLVERFRQHRSERSTRNFKRYVDEMIGYNLEGYARGEIEPRIRYVVEQTGEMDDGESSESGDITPMQVLTQLLQAESKPFFDPISKDHTELEKAILAEYGQGLVRVTEALGSYDQLKTRGIPSGLTYEEERMAAADLRLGDYLREKAGTRMRLMQVGVNTNLANSIETDLLSPERAISNGLFLPGQETPGTTLKGANFGVKLARHAYPIASQLIRERATPWNNPGLRAL